MQTPRLSAALLMTALLATASTTNAAIEQHAFEYKYALSRDGDNLPRLSLPGFDSQGGTRVLTRVDVRVQADLSATIAIENMTDAPLSDWTLEGQHIVLTGMERAGVKEPGPFAFMGGIFIDPFTAPLAAHDGSTGSGNDFLEQTASGSIDSLMDMDASYLSFFNGGGVIDVIVGPFNEHFLGNAEPYEPTLGTGQAAVSFLELTQEGIFTVSYEYAVLPEPTSLLGLAALAVRRRGR